METFTLTLVCLLHLCPTLIALSLDYEPPELPQGFVFQLQLLSTWGDLYYVGLNGVQFYDAAGSPIPLSASSEYLCLVRLG